MWRGHSGRTVRRRRVVRRPRSSSRRGESSPDGGAGARRVEGHLARLLLVNRSCAEAPALRLPVLGGEGRGCGSLPSHLDSVLSLRRPAEYVALVSYRHGMECTSPGCPCVLDATGWNSSAGVANVLWLERRRTARTSGPISVGDRPPWRPRA